MNKLIQLGRASRETKGPFYNTSPADGDSTAYRCALSTGGTKAPLFKAPTQFPNVVSASCVAQ